jgi:chromosome segregation ATPase
MQVMPMKNSLDKSIREKKDLLDQLSKIILNNEELKKKLNERDDTISLLGGDSRDVLDRMNKLQLTLNTCLQTISESAEKFNSFKGEREKEMIEVGVMHNALIDSMTERENVQAKVLVDVQTQLAEARAIIGDSDLSIAELERKIVDLRSIIAATR